MGQLFQKNDIFIQFYTIQFLLNKGKYAETYRIKNNISGKLAFLKLINYNLLIPTQFTSSNSIQEIEVLKFIKHPNLVKYIDSGNVVIEGVKYEYIIIELIVGETLLDKIVREERINQYDTISIGISVANALNQLHNKHGIIHNDITIRNIMLDLTKKYLFPILIDFGYARNINEENVIFYTEDLNPFYQSNEVLNGVFSKQSDIFSFGVLLYHMAEGITPWLFSYEGYSINELNESLIDIRRKPIKFKHITDLKLISVIKKALHQDTKLRYKSFSEIIVDLNSEFSEYDKVTVEILNKTKTPINKEGKGFDLIAGMTELKETLKIDVIDAILEKDKYKEYGLSIPNGILLYGPPGCGKTYFANRLAEELNFNFIEIKPSDIQSKWVNASQENIKNLFEDAIKNSPTVIFIDELDALVPNRDISSINHMNTSAVNEFLAQMNNLGEKGVFIIGATNRANAIDPAILRSGRLDKHIYVSPPDLVAREKMFEIYLKNRPCEFGIKYNELAKLTEKYVSSDIKFICDEAARNALKTDSKINFSIIDNVIKNTKPSLDSVQLYDFEQIKLKIEGDNIRQNTIGFKKN